MGEWDRSTRKLTLEKVEPAFRTTIQEHLETYNLERILDDYLICIETISTKKKKKLWGGIPNQTTQVVFVTPRWLVIAPKGENDVSPGVLSIQLKDAIAKDYKDEPGYRLIPDSGLNVTGAFTGRIGMYENVNITSFIALGEDAAAREFKEILLEAMQKAKV
jgi:hypothetical protein